MVHRCGTRVVNQYIYLFILPGHTPDHFPDCSFIGNIQGKMLLRIRLKGSFTPAAANDEITSLINVVLRQISANSFSGAGNYHYFSIVPHLLPRQRTYVINQ